VISTTSPSDPPAAPAIGVARARIGHGIGQRLALGIVALSCVVPNTGDAGRAGGERRVDHSFDEPEHLGPPQDDADSVLGEEARVDSLAWRPEYGSRRAGYTMYADVAMSSRGMPTAAIAARIALLRAALSEPASLGVSARVSTERMTLARSAGMVRIPSPDVTISGPRRASGCADTVAGQMPMSVAHAAATVEMRDILFSRGD
jgi:hypothetical protein